MRRQPPQVDRCIANLIQDLHDRGMDKDVVTGGEMEKWNQRSRFRKCLPARSARKGRPAAAAGWRGSQKRSVRPTLIPCAQKVEVPPVKTGWVGPPASGFAGGSRLGLTAVSIASAERTTCGQSRNV
jgi:hypothetical protein